MNCYSIREQNILEFASKWKTKLKYKMKYEWILRNEKKKRKRIRKKMNKTMNCRENIAFDDIIGQHEKNHKFYRILNEWFPKNERFR